MQDLFDRGSVEKFQNRYAATFHDHNFLFRWAIKELNERLSDITRQFENVLICGRHIDEDTFGYWKKKAQLSIITPDTLQHHAGKYDLIICLGELHFANDLPGTLVQLRRALKPDGVFMAAFAGGDTLSELRVSLMESETEVSGGVSPRIYPFVDKQQMAGLMQRAGFALPVVDSEKLAVSYRDLFHLFSDLRGMGESNALLSRRKFFTSSRVFFEAARTYQNRFTGSDGRIHASFEILFAIGWAPHESQQKPAKRGSGQVSLTEILG